MRHFAASSTLKWSRAGLLALTISVSSFAVLNAPFLPASAFQQSEMQRNDEFSAARTFLRQQQFDRAIEVLNQISADGTKAVTKYRLLSDAYLETGAGIAAQTAIERARELGADYALTAVPFAKALLLQHKYNDALKAMRGVRIPDEYIVDSYIVTGDANFALKQPARARQSYQAALDRDNSSFQAYLGLARLAMRDQDLVAAKGLADKALEFGADNTMVQYTVGLLARYNGDLATAEKHFLESVRIFPANVMSNVELAGLRIRQSRFQDAEIYLDKVYESAPRQPMALYLSAVMQAAKGAYQEASILLKQTGAFADNFLPAVYVKGLVSYELGDYQAATGALEKVVTVQPTNRTARLALASTYVKQSRTRIALRVLKPLLEVNAQDAAALSIAATAEMSVGNVDQGKIYLERLKAAQAQGPASSLSSLSSKIALAQFLQGNAEQAIETIANASAGRKAEIRELGILASMQIKSGDRVGARNTVDVLMRTAPERALGFNILGTIEYGEQNYTAAVEAYSQALQRNPEYFSALRNRGLAHYHLGQFAASERDLRKLLSSRPNDARSKAVLARTLLAKGSAEEAVQLFKEAVRDIPNSVPLLADYSQALADAGRTASAIEEARKTARAGADEPEVLRRMGLLLLELGQAQAAERPLSRYVAYNPDSGEAHMLHGRALLKSGLYTGARIAFERSLSASKERPDPKTVSWFLFAANVLSDKLEVALEQMAGLDQKSRPKEVPPGISADLLLKASRHNEAEQEYRAALRQHSDETLVIGLAKALIEQDRRTDAVVELNRYLDKQPGALSVHAALAEQYEFIGDFEAAAKQYRDILQKGAADAETAAKLANIYLELNNRQSVPLAERAYLLAPDDPFILDSYGWILLQAARNFEQAIPLLEKATRRAPSVATYKYHLGMAYLAQGRRRQAQKSLEQALSLNPDFPEAEEARRQLSQLEP